MLWVVEDNPQGVLSSYIIKVDERFSGRVISCYGDYSKSYWW